MKKTVSLLTAITMAAMLAPVGVSAGSLDSAPAAKPAVQKTAEQEFVQDQILVKFTPGATAADRANVHAKLGGQDKGLLGEGKSGWSLVKVPNGKAKEFAAKYANNPNVELAELDYVLKINAMPNDPLLSNQWHHTNVKSSQAWDTIQGSNKVIAILDTGVDLDHPDLKNKLVPGKNFAWFASTPNDDHGHGTHCAGIAAATGNNGVGIAGMDQTAKIMPVKVLNLLGSGNTSDIINGVYWATDNGADVLSMSLGGGSFSQSFQDAINYAWGKNKIVVAAAGNDGVSTKSYPAAYNNVLSVAATDQNDVKTSWSNYGADWVDVAAPGLNIYSTYYDGGYTTMSGTSMATPLVAGLVSLTWGKNPTASNATVVNRIETTADNTAGVGSLFEYGRVNAYNAVTGF